MKIEKASRWALTSYLVVLFAIINFVVLASAPEPKTAVEQQKLLEVHEGILYFYDAELMAKQIAPDPSLLWSHVLMDAHTGCLSIGHGVWYARGTIEGQANASPTPPNWEAFFLAEGPEPLFVRVGNMASGDRDAALHRAGYGNADAREPGEK